MSPVATLLNRLILKIVEGSSKGVSNRKPLGDEQKVKIRFEARVRSTTNTGCECHVTKRRPATIIFFFFHRLSAIYQID